MAGVVEDDAIDVAYSLSQSSDDGLEGTDFFMRSHRAESPELRNVCGCVGDFRGGCLLLRRAAAARGLRRHQASGKWPVR